jgi:hypothetical protein
MEIRLRTFRTLKVTELQLSAQTREMLAQLYDDPRYEALLDVMEQACISLETAHFNTSVGEPDEILGGHALAKGAWLFFTYVQKQVNNAYHTRTQEGSESPPPTFEDLLQGVETPYLGEDS